MNTKDINKTEIEDLSFSGDKLDQIFSGQKFLMENYKPIAEEHYSRIFGKKVEIGKEIWEGGEGNCHSKGGNFFIKDMLDACMHEISEAVQTLKNWKAWKQTEVPSDADHFKEELIDALHFYVEACILAGMTPEEVYNLYFKKHKVNRFRQESKY